MEWGSSEPIGLISSHNRSIFWELIILFTNREEVASLLEVRMRFSKLPLRIRLRWSSAGRVLLEYCSITDFWFTKQRYDLIHAPLRLFSAILCYYAPFYAIFSNHRLTDIRWNWTLIADAVAEWIIQIAHYWFFYPKHRTINISAQNYQFVQMSYLCWLSEKRKGHSGLWPFCIL